MGNPSSSLGWQGAKCPSPSWRKDTDLCCRRKGTIPSSCLASSRPSLLGRLSTAVRPLLRPPVRVKSVVIIAANTLQSVILLYCMKH